MRALFTTQPGSGMFNPLIPFARALADAGHAVAFACADRTELEEWQARLDCLGVQHGGIVDAHYGSGLSFRDPDNVALELFAPPA